MRFMVFLLLFGYPLVAQSAPSANGFPILHPGGIGGIFKGPDSETIVKGPDGSVITSAQEGGSIVVPETKLQPIIAAEGFAELQPAGSPEPYLSNAVAFDSGVGQVSGILENGPVLSAQPAPVLSAAPVIPAAPLIVTEPIQLAAHDEEPHRIDIELVDAPEVESDLSATLVGPSGTIVTKGSKSIVSGPASTTISEPVKTIKYAPIATPIVAAPAVHLAAQPVSIATGAPILSTVSVANLQPPIPVSTLAPPTHVDIGSISTLSNFGVGAISTLSPPRNVELGALSIASTLTPPNHNNIDIGAISTLAPYGNGNLNLGAISHNSVGIISSTLAPPLAISSTPSSLDLGGAIGIQKVQADPSSSYGVISNAHANNLAYTQGQVAYSSSTELPIISSTVAPKIRNLGIPSAQGFGSLGSNIQNYLDQTAIDNRQLALNPSEIPLANIIPPEIGVKGATYLGAAISVSEVPLESQNIQKIARIDNTVNIDDRLDNFDSQNELLTGEVLDSRNAIGQSYGNLGNGGYLAPQLSGYGVDPNQINVANVPLSQVSGLGSSGQGRSQSYGNVGNGGYLAPQLSGYGVNPNQINVANVPLEQVSGLGSSGQGRSQSYGNVDKGVYIASQLSGYRVDPNQINVANVPLSQVSSGEGRSYGYSRGGPAAWNGYSTDTRY